MKEKKIVELIELDEKRRWEYLKRYYEVGAMVRSLRNCPSIIMWEMGDEPLMLIHNFRRFKWYEQIYNLVKEEDKTRPIVPAGSFCLELVDRIENFKDKKLSCREKRRKVLEDLPVYGLGMAVWDYHYCPEVPPIVPCYTVVNRVKDALGGERPTVFTEFGFDGMPEPTLKLIEAYEGNPVPYAELRVYIGNINNEIIMHREFSGIMIKGNVRVTSACTLDLKGIAKGLYSIEYFLFDENENELAKNIELFYIV